MSIKPLGSIEHLCSFFKLKILSLDLTKQKVQKRLNDFNERSRRGQNCFYQVYFGTSLESSCWPINLRASKQTWQNKIQLCLLWEVSWDVQDDKDADDLEKYSWALKQCSIEILLNNPVLFESVMPQGAILGIHYFTWYVDKLLLERPAVEGE